MCNLYIRNNSFSVDWTENTVQSTEETILGTFINNVVIHSSIY